MRPDQHDTLNPLYLEIKKESTENPMLAPTNIKEPIWVTTFESFLSMAKSVSLLNR
jgi:hypothetical protein